jgi:hypothetical protein
VEKWTKEISLMFFREGNSIRSDLALRPAAAAFTFTMSSRRRAHYLCNFHVYDLCVVFDISSDRLGSLRACEGSLLPAVTI